MKDEVRRVALPEVVFEAGDWTLMQGVERCRGHIMHVDYLGTSPTAVRSTLSIYYRSIPFDRSMRKYSWCWTVARS